MPWGRGRRFLARTSTLLEALIGGLHVAGLTIAPAYDQTAWLEALVVGAFLGALSTAHRIRVQRLAREFHLMLEARVAERTRMSRDLHDTLQSSQAVLLKFESVLKLLPDRPPEAEQRLQRALDQATTVTIEARRAIQGLERSTIDTTHLAPFIADIGEALTAGRVDAPAIHVTADGISRPLNPLVRDDGTGIDAEVLQRRAIEGHFGLHGMRERADMVGGRLRLWSSAGLGTHVELTVPAAIACAAASDLSPQRDDFGIRAADDRRAT